MRWLGWWPPRRRRRDVAIVEKAVTTTVYSTSRRDELVVILPITREFLTKCNERRAAVAVQKAVGAAMRELFCGEVRRARNDSPQRDPR